MPVVKSLLKSSSPCLDTNLWCDFGGNFFAEEIGLLGIKSLVKKMSPKRGIKMAYQGNAKRRMSMRIRDRQGMSSALISREPITIEISEPTNHSSTDSESHTHIDNEIVGSEDDSSASKADSEPRVSENTLGSEQNQDPSAQEPEDTLRFVNKVSELKYQDNFSKRVVLCERGIKLEDYAEQPYELQELFLRRHWSRWVTTNRTAIVPYVREFYANAELGALHGRPVITSKVRRKVITLSPEKIASFGFLPIGGVPAVTPQQESQWNEQLSKDNLAKLLSGNPQAQWVGARLYKSNLSPRSNVLHMLLCSQILPHAFKSSITLEQAIMMGKLLLNIPIDLPQHIWSVIAQVVEKPEAKSGLPFGGLITQIVLQHGIKEEVGMATVQPASMIAKTSVKRSQGQLGRKNLMLPAHDQQEEREGVNESASANLDEKINLIQRNQEILINEVKGLKKGQKKMMQLLKKLVDLGQTDNSSQCS